MKDAADQVTADLIQTPKKRGRPVTGNAMTTAQRKRAQRLRDAEAIWAPEDEGGKHPEEMTVTALLEGLRECVKDHAGGMAKRLADELVRRARNGA
jgi:hypothetical protein